MLRSILRPWLRLVSTEVYLKLVIDVQLAFQLAAIWKDYCPTISAWTRTSNYILYTNLPTYTRAQTQVACSESESLGRPEDMRTDE